MKYTSIILIMVFGLISQTAGSAQRPIRNELKAQKVAFITEQLALSAIESEKFWPIYNEREKELLKLREEFKATRKLKSIDEMTDAEVEKLIEKRFQLEETKVTVNRKYFKKMKQIIPIKKIAQLSTAERQWKRQLVKRVKRKQRK